MKKLSRDAASRAVSKSAKVDVGRDDPREGARALRRQSQESRGARGSSRSSPNEDPLRALSTHQNRPAAAEAPQAPRAPLHLRSPEPILRQSFSHGRLTPAEKVNRLLPGPHGPQLPAGVAAKPKNAQPASSAGRVVDAKDELPAKLADPEHSALPLIPDPTSGAAHEAPKSSHTDSRRADSILANVVKTTRATETPVTPVGPSTLLTEKEVAAMLSLSSATLRNWRVKGLGPRFVHLSRRAVRYSRADVDEWVASRSRHSTSAREVDNG